MGRGILSRREVKFGKWVNLKLIIRNRGRADEVLGYILFESCNKNVIILEDMLS